MRVFAVSDIHIDYEENAHWVANLSAADYKHDLLILAGDVTDMPRSLEWCLGALAARFKQVLFVPGNHDLWVIREGSLRTSLEKLDEVAAVAESAGVSMRPFHGHGLAIYPLLGWYDGSFGEPSERLKSLWMDYLASAAFNEPHIPRDGQNAASPHGETVITFSHFLPRQDILPAGGKLRTLLRPVLGTTRLEHQLRRCKPRLHVFGHSHVNCHVELDGVTYVNNAFGYPDETQNVAKRLLCIHEC